MRGMCCRIQTTNRRTWYVSSVLRFPNTHASPEGEVAARIRLETVMIKRDSVQQQRYTAIVSRRPGCHEKHVRTMDCSEADLLDTRRSALSSIDTFFSDLPLLLLKKHEHMISCKCKCYRICWLSTGLARRGSRRTRSRPAAGASFLACR